MRSIDVLTGACLIALGAGCATPRPLPEPPPEVPELELPGDPVVTLLEAGAEPRAPLRYRIPAGQRTTLLVDTDLMLQVAPPGTPARDVPTPTTRITMAVEVVSVAPDGTTANTALLTAAEVLAKADDNPAMVDQMKKALSSLIGFRTDMKLTPRGFTRDVKIDVPAGVRPELQSMLQNLRQATEQIAVTFPREAVGEGARWSIEANVDNGTIKLRQKTTAKLESIGLNRVFLALTIEQTAPPQALRTAGLPPGVTVALESYSGSGWGRLEALLDSRALRSEATLSSSVTTSTTARKKRATVTMRMKMNLKIAPGR